MASKSMRAVVKTLLHEVERNGGLRSLLVASEHEDERPHLKIAGVEYAVGLVGDNCMLMRLRDKELVNPDIIGDNNVTEIVWKLK